MFKKADEKQILKWIHDQNWKAFGQYLVSGSVHGKPGIPTAEMTRVEKILHKNLSPSEAYELGKVLIKRPEYTARSIAIGFISLGEKYPEMEKLILQAAEDEEWIVREVAASGMTQLLRKDFKHFSKVCQKWVDKGSVNAKRAVALAVKYHSKAQDATYWKTYLSLIEPLLAEEAEYIQKNLGPFAIGDGLLPRFPEETLRASQVWMKSKNENVRWNTAMIFTAAAARKHKEVGEKILKPLLNDEDSRVARAAKKAAKNLEKA